MNRPIQARDFSGVWDPEIPEVVQRPDFDRMRRYARLAPDDPGYNPRAMTLAEIDQLEQQWIKDHPDPR